MSVQSLRAMLPTPRSNAFSGEGPPVLIPTIVVALCVFLWFQTDNFLTTTNLTNLLGQAAVLGIVAFGVTFCILSGELDLSVGTGCALVTVVAATVMVSSGSILLGVLVGLGTGLAIGCANAFIVTVLQVPSFIATLGMMVIAGGVALAITDGAVVTGLPAAAANIASGEILGVRAIVWIFAATFVVLYFVQARTVFGTRVMAVGSNADAARLAGVRVNRVRTLCFLISGLTIGIGGIALMSRVESGQPNAAALLELNAIAAIVIGGSSLFGGRGSMARTLWGVLLIATLQNGLDLLAVQDEFKRVIVGAVLIGAASSTAVAGAFRRVQRQRGGGRRSTAALRMPPGISPSGPQP